MQPTLMLERPRKVTVVESIVEQLVRQIQAGNLKTGDKLPSERRLIEMLKVSRSSVREALQGLAVMGLVESCPGQGTFVSSNLRLLAPDIDNPALPATLQRDMRLKLIESRLIIEAAITRLAAERATEDSLARLRRIFDQYRDMTLDHAHRRAMSGPHHDFHAALAEMTQNPFFALVIETLLRAVPYGLRESEFAPLRDPGTLAAQIELHQAILDAVERKDGPAAQQAMEAHMAFERRIVLQIFAGADTPS